jgi:hypothetical protein
MSTLPANASHMPALSPQSSRPPRTPRTLGGLVFWTDIAVRHSWRVQVSSRNGLCRVLDPQERKVMSGDRAGCLAAFNTATADLPARAAVVMVVHPMGGSRLWMLPTERRLRAAGFHVESFTYASLRDDVPAHAASLNEVIAGWEDVRAISFVTVSMGGPVVAHALAAQPAWQQHIAVTCAVLMCPPAQGAALARIGQRLPPARAVLGPSLKTLAAKPMPTSGFVDIPTLIVAGKIPLGNPLLRGPDDGIVRVAETRIDVPHKHLIVSAFHAGVQHNPTAKRAVVEWLVQHHHVD